MSRCCATAIDMKQRKECSLPGCGKRAPYEKYCVLHYNRWRRHGDPLAGRTPEGEPLRFFTNVVRRHTDDKCLIWPFAKDSAGYGQLWLDDRVNYVARLICEDANGLAPSDRHQAAHLCGNGHNGCCAPAHLVWKLPSANQSDRETHGTMLRGEKAPWAKLTLADIKAIRTLALDGLTQREIALRFDVSRSLVGLILQGKRWAVAST